MAEETNNIETIELHRCPHCGKILTRGMQTVCDKMECKSYRIRRNDLIPIFEKHKYKIKRLPGDVV